jgi:predicted DNA-binding transcriptional regulator AlpA
MPAEIIPELLNEKLVRAHYLPIGARTLWRWVSCGQFPKPDVAFGGKVRLWRKQTVLAWIAARAAEGRVN